MINKAERIRQLVGVYGSTAKAAKRLGVSQRSINRYMDGTRSPSATKIKKASTTVYNKLAKGGIYRTEKVKWSDGTKFTRRTRVKGNLAELKDETLVANDHIDAVVKSGEEAGNTVTSHNIRYHFVE